MIGRRLRGPPLFSSCATGRRDVPARRSAEPGGANQDLAGVRRRGRYRCRLRRGNAVDLRACAADARLQCSCRPARSQHTQARKPRSPRSTTPRTAPTPSPAIKTFAADYGAKWPKAVAKITDDLDVLLAFYDYPAEHWIHLRTTNPIESTFATVRLRHGHQGPRLPGRRRRDGVQAHRVRTDPVAGRQRTPPRRPRPCRRPIREGQARRTTRRIRRRSASRVRRRSTGLDYSSLTIAERSSTTGTPQP